MHSQIPQMNKMPNAISSRRPSTQFHNTGQPLDPRYPNNPHFTDDRNLASQYDQFYKPNPESWNVPASTQNQITNQKSYTSSNLPSGYNISDSQIPPQSSYQLQQQQSLDQTNQQHANQNRRLSSSIRPSTNQRPSQDWNAGPGITRRQSILAQPMNDPQTEIYVDSTMASYRRNELRTGTVHSEGPLDRQATNPEPQGYRQAIDQQAYRQPIDQQIYQQSSMNQQMYRQTPDKQIYRQQAIDQQSYRQPTSSEQEIINGERETRQQGSRPSIDYFDHYKRPPSRDSSVDRYGRRSRQPSVEAVPPGVGSRAGSVAPSPITASRPASRAATPAGNGHLASGRGSIPRAPSKDQPFEDSLLRKRTLGQEIVPSPYQPKRTESLFMPQNPAPPPPAPMGGGGGGGRKVSNVKCQK